MTSRPDEETLRRLYVSEHRTMAEIARPYGVSAALVRKWLLRAGIPTRSPAEARKIAKKPVYTEAGLRSKRESAARSRSYKTPESYRKQSETRKRLGLGGHNKGIPMSDEQRKKLIELRSDPEYRRIASERFSGEKNWNWRGGVKSEIDRRLDRAEWRRTRVLVYERDGWKCQDCGERCLNTADSKKNPRRKIQCHHIVSRRNGGGDEMGNLVTLCMSCHHRRERKEVQR